MKKLTEILQELEVSPHKYKFEVFKRDIIRILKRMNNNPPGYYQSIIEEVESSEDIEELMDSMSFSLLKRILIQIIK